MKREVEASTPNGAMPSSEWKLAMELIQELSHSRIQPSVICCNALLTAYANSTLWERALHLFLHMEKELRADDVSLGAAIAACSDFSTWPWALSLLFSQLRGRRGVSAVLRDDRPNAVAINAALRSCEISTAWASAMGVHAEFGEFSLRAEEHITRARHMMAICGRAGRWEWALFFFDRAMKYGASETSYNTAITACERSVGLSLGNLRMCSNRLASTRSYGSIINAFQSSAQWRLAVQLLHQMWIDRTEWNTVTCNAALSSCEKAGERKMALFLLQSMTRQSVQADEITYNAAISACERTDRWDLALHLLAEMQSNSLPPSDTSLTAAISACKTPGEWERALRLMAGLGMQQAPSTISTNALLFCLAHASQSCMERWLSPLTENGFRSGMLTLTTTALGGGVLSVAFVMNICGIALGCMILALGALLAYLGMAALMEMSTKTGCSSYAALFSHCAGHLAGPILDAFLFVCGNGACVGYMVFIGDFVPPVLALMFPGETWAQDTTGLSRTCCIAIAAVLLVPMMLPYDLSRLKFLQPVSIMALVYMAIVVAVKCPHSFSVNVGKHGYESIRWFTLSPHFFEAFALCVFAFNCHLNVVPIADQLVRPTVERTKKISIRVNLFQWLFYSLIGVTGYLSFLDDTSSDILTNYSPHDYFVAAGRCFLTLTMMVAIPANLNPTDTSYMGWIHAGITIFCFAAPSAVMAMPFAIGNAGFLGGMILCLIVTGASILGAKLLLRLKLLYPDCKTFGDIGFQVLGTPGKIWGNLIQLGNFCLFMPCALRFCGLALKGIGNFPGFDECVDYYVFVVAFVCLVTTQVRSFKNAQCFTVLSLACVIGMVLSMVYASFRYENPHKIPAMWFGNPEPEEGLRLIRLAGGCSIAAWAFIPGFLTVELSSCLAEPSEFNKSLLLAGALNVLGFCAGCVVIARWGYKVGEVIAVTPVMAWTPGLAVNSVFNACQLGGNFVSYMLDSVPLGRFCQRAWAPDFKDTWSAGDIGRYLTYTLPVFAFALTLSVFTPSINVLLDFTTALTTPWVSHVYPAVIYWRLKTRGGINVPPQPMTIKEKLIVSYVFLVGCLAVFACFVKAIGFLVFEELRPKFQVGCDGWLLWKPRRARGGEESGNLAVGDTVSALCPDDDQWYPGAIDKINDDGTFSVKWDDPDGGPETHDVGADGIKKIVIFKDYKVGERVEAVFPDDGYWYPGEVTKVGDGTFTVKWDDPDGGPEESELEAKDVKYPPIPYGKLEVGQKYTGTVASVLDFGAFVDIGAEGQGLLHISRISQERVENIYDVLSEGQQVDVWISGKREDEGKFGLTMVEGLTDGPRRKIDDLTPFADLSSDEWYKGVVARTAPFGAFVTVTLDDGASADGLVHVSKIKDGFVDNVDDEVSNRPYGWCVALVVSALQLAPLVEMVDKLGDGVCWGLREEETSPLQSVLSSSNHGRQAQEMKGSRYGENLMRGLRKLSIASLPLIFLSAIVHSAWLLEESQDGRQQVINEAQRNASHVVTKVLLMTEDVVLYVWVDDAFVRHHKKLVQVHYFVEILTRLPLLCLLLNMESVGYIALLSLLACDLSASVLLLLMPTLLGWRRRMSCRHASSQVASAVIMSEILFFVNITMFDPREAFQVINMGFYIVKYLEAFIVCRILPWSIRSGEFRTTFQEVQLAAVVLNAFLVWVVVPKLRSMQDAAIPHRGLRGPIPPGAAVQDMPRLSELVPRDERDAHPSASRSQFFGLPETIALELSTVGSPQHVVRENRVESARLELLGDMLEGLCLTSEAQSDRNRPAVARSTVADVLWSLVLPWSGEYVESTSGGRIWLEILDPERGAILIRRERSSSDPDPSVGRWVESLGVVFQGTAIEAVLDVAEGRVLGTHTGEEIRFADANGTIWRRGIVEGSSGSSGSSSSSSSSSSGAREQESAAREVLRLVLTQVLLSLRWEPTFLGLGVVGAGKAKAGDLVAIDAARRPLLSFLLRYAIGTHDLSFISEIYWSLWCLSQDYLDPNRAAYDKARWVLINALEGNIEFWDSIRGAGDTAEKTRAIRHRLHEMKQREDQATDPEERYLVYLEDSYLLERLEVDASLLAATQAASLVRQPRDFRSTPVDPSVPFLGVNIGHCEILKSNAAPLLLGCLQEPDSGCGLDLEAGDGMRRTVSETQVDRYMVKVGDDLRQDQLVLQMLHLMELVWQERVRVRLPRGRSAVRERLTKCCTCSRFRRARVLLRSHVATFVVRSVCSFVPERVLPCGPDDARTEERLPKEENDMLRFVPYRDPSQTRHA
eukprot:g117.t1